MTVIQATPFERELAFFERHRVDLLNRAPGKFVLIKAEKLVDIFDTEIDAVRAGYRQFGNEPFLVKQIVDADIPLNFTAFNLGA